MAKTYVKCDDPVRVTCYGETRTWERADAINYYMQGIGFSDGSEQQRYANIVYQLARGAKEARDI